MRKDERYELLYTKISWAIIIAGLLQLFLSSVLIPSTSEPRKLWFNLLLLALGSLLIIIKLYIIKRGFLRYTYVFIIIRVFDMIGLSYSLSYVKDDRWICALFVLPILITCLGKGSKLALIMISFSFITQQIFYLVGNNINTLFGGNYLQYISSKAFSGVVFYYIILVLLTILFDMISKDTQDNEQENARLLKALAEKYEQLSVAQEEVKLHYEKEKEINIALEDTNKKLMVSVAEFFTLQKISQVINSVFDIKELLKCVNDIIIGVMGVSTSSIILYDEKKKILKVHTSNIVNVEERMAINDNINCSILVDVLKSSKPIMENHINQDRYTFTRGRGIQSLICVPLCTKSRKFGLVLIEHKHDNFFNQNNVRLLDIIGQQVGIAMENAELYQKMHELATVDGLTGIFNRLYFQDRMQEEFDNARKENYELSLAIFDIDHFKSFNDTYGHLFGDKVLKSLADLVKSSLRSTDIFARYGGEEFIILFPRTSLEEAYTKVESIKNKISEALVKDGLVTSFVTASFGVACFPRNAKTESELIRMADDALYSAKASGRNCVRVSNAP